MQSVLNIRFLNRREYALSKELWLECFEEDGREFVDWYYSERSKPRYVLGAFGSDSEIPVAMMHLIPMIMRFNGRKVKVCFVSGVCTKPEYRGRGICGSLFDRAFEYMDKKGYEASVLQPFDTAFYERFGYKTFIWHNVISLSDERLNAIVRTTEQIKPTPWRLYKLYKRAMEGKSGCTIRSARYFRSFIHEYSLPGAILICTEYGCCAGYAACESGGTVRATELFYTDGADPLALLPQGFSSLYFPLPVESPVPEGCTGSIVPFSMIKPIRASSGLFTGLSYGFDRY